jgi:hypothetical protein
MKKLMLIIVATTANTSLALAAPPSRIEESFDEPAGSFNNGAFDVRISEAGKAKTINLPGERFITTSPGLDATLTNLSNPSKTVTLNITGAMHQSTTQTGDILTVATGRNLLGDPVAGLVLAIGNFSFVFDKNGVLVQPLIGHGQLIDVCALIA